MKYSRVKEAIKQSDKDTVRGVLDDYSEEVLEAALECGISISDVAEAYQGEHKSDADFVEQLLEDCGDLPKLPHYVYIDWERTARDVMMDYCEHNGHYFRNL
jgi:antirestriction protein